MNKAIITFYPQPQPQKKIKKKKKNKKKKKIKKKKTLRNSKFGLTDKKKK